MDTAWIQVFVLTFAECVAPAGKTVCQQQQFELEFLTRRDCEYALEQLVTMKDALDNVIVDHGKSGCAVSAREAGTFASADAIQQANADNWHAPANVDQRRVVVNEAHQQRLADLKPCSDTNGAAPCKIGQIIVEEATGDSVEVWRRTD
ncbi:MAG: hypothetical protein AAFN50_02425 [Pseudomonadota bacterium]